MSELREEVAALRRQLERIEAKLDRLIAASEPPRSVPERGALFDVEVTAPSWGPTPLSSGALSPWGEEPPPDPALTAAVLELLRRRQRDAAVERYRSETGADEGAAEAVIRGLERDHIRRG